MSFNSAEETDKADDSRILDALDKAIREGPWESSLFLRGIGKKLQEIRDRFQAEVDAERVARPLLGREPNVQGLVEVYISLYQSDGDNIKKWESVVTSLAGHTISRPVYRREEDLRSSVRGSKGFTVKDAYVLVKVDPVNILATTSKPSAVSGEPERLALREGAVKLANIVYFFHDGHKYKLVDHALVRQA